MLNPSRTELTSLTQDSWTSSRLFDYNPEYTERGEGEEYIAKDLPFHFNANSSKMTKEKLKDAPMANHYEYYKL